MDEAKGRILSADSNKRLTISAQGMSEELLPPTEELASLTETQTIAVIDAIDRSNRREHSYALTAMLCGTISFLCAVAGFVYLVVQGHIQAAEVLLGAAVLAIVGQMIRSRLRL